MYLWMRFASILWPARDLKTSLSKGLVEQLAYDPFAISSFLFGMSLMEGRTRHEAYDEVSTIQLHNCMLHAIANDKFCFFCSRYR